MGLILLTAFCPHQVAMGAAQLGFLATFMLDPMISGFTTGSAVLVVISQVKHILGLKVPQIPAPLAAPKVNNVILCIQTSRNNIYFQNQTEVFSFQKLFFALNVIILFITFDFIVNA